MNKITLNGIIRNIQTSHSVNDIDYGQADLICPRKDGLEDIISLKYKRLSNKYKEGDTVDLTGNLRSYSKHLDSGKNKVSLYVFTYFDIPENLETNTVELDGRICKIEGLRTTKNGQQNIHLILANNLHVSDNKQKLNSYIPCIAWGKLARQLSKLSVNDKIEIIGELHSRQYKKMISENEFEFRVAHECMIKEFKVL